MVAALFVRSDSCYFELGVDCWDAKRDARSYTEPGPVIAHPPCRGWGRLSHLAKPRPDEKALALFAVDTVRRCGGVLEHPVGSKLWAAKQLPRVAQGCDEFGGFTLVVDQGWWGHPAPKPTYLYIVGCTRADIGELPVQLHRAAGRTMRLSPADRERTPPRFAEFLLGIARKCAGSVLLRPGCAVTSSQDVDSYTDLVAGAAAKRAAFKAWAQA
ncbi:hypothetical protein [Variovorax sp. PBL-E5]|uniref:hypothetical protein n=1 Tax=Variovorax sp. PBL-E5 TaxID=434014 RepID=UPI001317A290|nr:hypothetical protein [Variovorax sp. PBL-E5]VTU36352.1 hypothetical protein E5CHR_04296 [Variovorax sp. PBL-E5]